MQPDLTNTENVTLEKAKWVEEQANRILDFRVETRELLVKEAHTTLQWLFAIILGASGFIVSLVRPDQSTSLQPSPLPWWLIVPLVGVVIVASVRAIILLQKGLRIVPFPSKGNEPKNIATDSFLAHDEDLMRLVEARNLQERISEIRAGNQQIADAINRARFTIIVLAPLTVIASALLWWMAV